MSHKNNKKTHPNETTYTKKHDGGEYPAVIQHSLVNGIEFYPSRFSFTVKWRIRGASHSMATPRVISLRRS